MQKSQKCADRWKNDRIIAIYSCIRRAFAAIIDQWIKNKRESRDLTWKKKNFLSIKR